MKHRQRGGVTSGPVSDSWFGGAWEARQVSPGVVGAAMTWHNGRIMHTSRHDHTRILVLVT